MTRCNDRQQHHYGYVPNYANVISDRPDTMHLWAELQASIRRPIRFREMDEALRERLVVGRPISSKREVRVGEG